MTANPANSHERFIASDHASEGQAIRRVYLPGASTRAKSAQTEQIGPELLIDYSADGSPLGIEIVSLGYVAEAEINAPFDRLGLKHPSPAELALLRAA